MDSGLRSLKWTAFCNRELIFLALFRNNVCAVIMFLRRHMLLLPFIFLPRLPLHPPFLPLLLAILMFPIFLLPIPSRETSSSCKIEINYLFDVFTAGIRNVPTETAVIEISYPLMKSVWPSLDLVFRDCICQRGAKFFEKRGIVRLKQWRSIRGNRLDLEAYFWTSTK